MHSQDRGGELRGVPEIEALSVLLAERPCLHRAAQLSLPWEDTLPESLLDGWDRIHP